LKCIKLINGDITWIIPASFIYLVTSSSPLSILSGYSHSHFSLMSCQLFYLFLMFSSRWLNHFCCRLLNFNYNALYFLSFLFTWQNHCSNLISESSKYFISNAISLCFSYNTSKTLYLLQKFNELVQAAVVVKIIRFVLIVLWWHCMYILIFRKDIVIVVFNCVDILLQMVCRTETCKG
jgi:hypothetical protein